MYIVHYKTYDIKKPQGQINEHSHNHTGKNQVFLIESKTEPNSNHNFWFSFENNESGLVRLLVPIKKRAKRKKQKPKP